jgi:hypothetical protein
MSGRRTELRFASLRPYHEKHWRVRRGGGFECFFGKADHVGRSALLILLSFAIGLSTLHPETVPDARNIGQAYIFVSANTRSRMTDEDARRSFDSFEQKNAVAVADRASCSLTHSVQIDDVLGVKANDSENSLVIETDLTSDLNEYLASLVGRYTHQEYVLSFMRRKHGPDKIWMIHTDRPVTEAVEAIRKSSLAPATVRDDHGRTELLFVDIGSNSAEKIRTLASTLRGKTWTADGVATLRGNDDRMQAAANFDAEIQNVEKHSAYRLSSHLWTKNWHDATSRTCSSGLSRVD